MKTYQAGDLQIVDISGKKTIEGLKIEFNKEEIVDITEAENAKIEANKLAEKERPKEKTLEERVKALEEKLGREVA